MPDSRIPSGPASATARQKGTDAMNFCLLHAHGLHTSIKADSAHHGLAWYGQHPDGEGQEKMNDE